MKQKEKRCCQNCASWKRIETDKMSSNYGKCNYEVKIPEAVLEATIIFQKRINENSGESCICFEVNKAKN